MKTHFQSSLFGLLIAAMLATGCAFEQSSKLLNPAGPSDNGGAAVTTTAGGSSTSGGGSGNNAASAFAGAWDSSTIAGLPLGNCSDVKWLITAQTATSLAGTVTATCASGVSVAANLTGTLENDDVVNLVATGTLTAMGLPCQFNLTGVGTRQSRDEMKVDYSGTYCFGSVNGSEVLRNPEAKPPVVLEPPIPVSPSNGTTLSSIAPQFTLKAGNRSGVTGRMQHILEVSNDSSFTSIAARFYQDETLPDTTIATGYSFLNSKTYYWRARTEHDGGADASNWSSTKMFKTPVPTDGGGGGGGNGGGGGGGGTNPASCSSSKGSDIAKCIEARYPQYRRAGVSLDQRKRDMQFLRDRLIEHATCRGLTVGLNLKRGGPEISNDFITFFTLGRWVGVDIAGGYDDRHSTLTMMWYQHGASTNWGHPFHKAYGSVNCNWLSRGGSFAESREKPSRLVPEPPNPVISHCLI